MKKLTMVISLAVVFLLMALPMFAKGQQDKADDIVTITFVDTDAGANIQLLFREVVIPEVEAKHNIRVNYITANGPEMLQRVKGWGDREGDIALLHVKPQDATAFFGSNIPLVRLTDHLDLIPNLAKVNADVMKTVLGLDINGRATSMFRFTMALMYDSAKVSNPPRSWKELYDRREEWKGRIGFVRTDAQSTGGRRMMYEFMTAFGVDFSKPLDQILNSPEYKVAADAWKDLAANFNKPAASSAPILFQKFSDGDVWLAQFALDFTLSSRDQGMLPPTVKGMLLQEGHSGGANGYFIIPENIDSRKKQAAMQVINVALSNDVQQKMAERFYLYPSTDIEDELPESLWEIVPPLADLNVMPILSNDWMNYILEKGMDYIPQ